MVISEQAAEELLQILRGYLWHTTSVDRFRGIVGGQCIKVNDGSLPTSHSQSKSSNCFELGAVSLFDIVTHRDKDLMGQDLLLLHKWPGVMFRHQPTVFLGVELASVATNLLFYPEVKQRCGLGGIIPRIEVCHVGNIPFALVKKIGICRDYSSPKVCFYPNIQGAIDDLAA